MLLPLPVGEFSHTLATMPFGPYDDFADCVAQNQGVDDPEAYCAWLQKELKDEANVVSSDDMKLQIVAVKEDAFADENGDGIDDVTGEPLEDVEEEVIKEIVDETVDDMLEDFHSLLVVEGVWTGDGRYIDDEALTWRNLPLPLMGLDKTTDAHMEARLIGNITRIERDGREIHGYGTFVKSDDAEVQRLQKLISDGSLRGVSVDLDAMEYEVVIPAGMNNPQESVDENGDTSMLVEDMKMRVTAARIMGATVVPFPAFEEAYIESLATLTAAIGRECKLSGYITTMQSFDDIDFTPPAGARAEAEKGLAWRDEYGRGGTAVGIARARDISNGKKLSPSTINRMVSFFARHEVDKQGQGWSPDEDGFPSNGRIAWALWGGDPGRTWAEKVQGQMQSRQESGSIIASGYPISAPVCPPKDWFVDPKLSGPTPMTVTDEGRIYGHVATWGSCHIGFSDQCVTPPRSQAAYQHYLTGEVLCDDGCRVPVGQITMDTGHAPLNANGAKALAHYDNTGTAVADVRTGEDEYGIWMAGALRPDLDPVKIRGLMASDVSGDWRRIGGHLELVGVLAVNVPGFPKARVQVGEYDGLVASLIASLPAEPQPAKDLSKAADRIAASIGRSKQERLTEIRNRIKRG